MRDLAQLRKLAEHPPAHPDPIETARARLDQAITATEEGRAPRIRTRHDLLRRRRTGILAGGLVVLGGVALTAAIIPWPNTGASYIVCFDGPNIASGEAPLRGGEATLLGFDQSDPIGSCLSAGRYDDGPRPDLIACQLATEVAGVFPVTGTPLPTCTSLGYRDWTP